MALTERQEPLTRAEIEEGVGRIVAATGREDLRGTFVTNILASTGPDAIPEIRQTRWALLNAFAAFMLGEVDAAYVIASAPESVLAGAER